MQSINPIPSRTPPSTHESSKQRSQNDSDNILRAWRKGEEVARGVQGLSQNVHQIQRQLDRLRRRGGSPPAVSTPGTVTNVQRMVITDSTAADYWVCKSWQFMAGYPSVTEGGAVLAAKFLGGAVNVARPENIRASVTTINLVDSDGTTPVRVSLTYTTSGVWKNKALVAHVLAPAGYGPDENYFLLPQVNAYESSLITSATDTGGGQTAIVLATPMNLFGGDVVWFSNLPTFGENVVIASVSDSTHFHVNNNASQFLIGVTLDPTATVFKPPTIIYANSTSDTGIVLSGGALVSLIDQNVAARDWRMVALSPTP